MVDHLKNKRTGNTRLKPETISVGLFKKATVLVHQSEIAYRTTIRTSGTLNTETRFAWIPTKPEWLLENVE